MGQTFSSFKDSYHVEKPFAQGGMGVAYLAKSQKTGKQFFVKQLKIEHAENWKAIELFEREAKLLSKLKHKNIPAYVDSFFAKEQNCFILVQSFVEGNTLQKEIEEKTPFSIEKFSHYLTQGLEILSYLHTLIPPIIHRDITPRNLIIEGEKLYLVDFGSVKSAVAASTTMTTVGTFGYMSPEQILGQTEVRSDLYSLGMSFIALATHSDPQKLPLNKKTGRIDIEQVLKLPDHLNHLLQDMIQPGVDERLQSAKAGLERLKNKQSFIRKPAIIASKKDTPGKNTVKQKTSRKRVRRFFQGAGILLLVILLVGWMSTFSSYPGEIHRLGGWFTGHAGTISAITGTLWGDYSALTSSNAIRSVTFSPDGTLLASVDDEGQIIVWDPSTGNMLHHMTKEDLKTYLWIQDLLFTQDGKGLLLIGINRIVLLDTENWNVLQTISLSQLEYEISENSYSQFNSFAAPTKNLIIGSYIKDADVYLFDLRNREILHHWNVTGLDAYNHKVTSAFSLDGNLFVLGDKQNIHIWETETGNKVQTISAPKKFETLILDGSGKYLATLDTHGIMIWNTQTGIRQKAIAQDDYYSTYDTVLKFSPSAKQIAVAHDSSICIFSTEIDDQFSCLGEKTYSYFYKRIHALDFSPNKEILASGGNDQLVRIWQIPTLPK